MEDALRRLDGEIGALKIVREKKVGDFISALGVRAQEEGGVGDVAGVGEGGFWVPGGQGL